MSVLWRVRPGAYGRPSSLLCWRHQEDPGWGHQDLDGELLVGPELRAQPSRYEGHPPVGNQYDGLRPSDCVRAYGSRGASKY